MSVMWVSLTFAQRSRVIWMADAIWYIIGYGILRFTSVLYLSLSCGGRTLWVTVLQIPILFADWLREWAARCCSIAWLREWDESGLL